jgi:predicted RNA-binding protein with PIN domain
MGDPRGVRRWIVDAMNVIGTRPDRWWNDPDAAMRRMTHWIDLFAEHTGDDVTLVFDKKVSGIEAERIRVVFAKWKGRNAADHEIEELVEADPEPQSLSVVTSDKRLAERVRTSGARVVSSGTFRKRLDSVVKSSEKR